MATHAEAVDASEHAAALDGSFHNGYQVAETLLTAKRYMDATARFRALLRRPDATAQPPTKRADVQNHLAVALLATAGAAPRGGEAARGLRRAALEASRQALRLQPACPHTHAHNYYQILASHYIHAERLDLATAALWPVAAMAWGQAAPADSAAYARAGFRALAWAQRRAEDARAATGDALEAADGADASESRVAPSSDELASASASGTLEELRRFTAASHVDRLWTLDSFARRMASLEENGEAPAVAAPR